MKDPLHSTLLKRIPRLVVQAPRIDGNLIRQVSIRSHEVQVSQDGDGKIHASCDSGETFEIIGLNDTRPRGEIFLRWSDDDASTCLEAADLNAGQWFSNRSPGEATTASASYSDRFVFKEENAEEGIRGLRLPQVGAVHAVLGYWSTSRKESATVVMPTGTGKTDVMIALTVAASLDRLLVLVPSDALRSQLSEKFLDLGVLPDFGIVAPSCIHPVVGLIQEGFSSPENAAAFAHQCNVMIATPDALMASGNSIRAALLETSSCLFVDEAHHVVATTWAAIHAHFSGKRIVQFTATPYREDKKSIGGKIVYDFPLREAQRLGYFRNINYRSIVDFADQDGAIARAAVAQLTSDVETGYDHLVMARVNSIQRAEAVVKIYQQLAPQFSPVCLHSKLSAQAQVAGLAGMRSRRNRIIVCVNMLGEGFDLPSLKIAAIHDPHKSLGITLQFVGRFARSAGIRLGDATVIVARPRGNYDEQIRKLYAEDADWNSIISDLSESAIGNEESVQEFHEGFTLNPLDISVHGISPKMSTVAFHVRDVDWNPDGVIDVYPIERLVTYPYSINEDAGVLWFVIRRISPVPWGVSNQLENVVYELFVVFHDRTQRLLFINSSENEGHHEDLAAAICGQGATRVQGIEAYRAFAEVNHLVPTNIGTRDIRSRNRSHTMHAGSNVTEGFTGVDMHTKTQTNLFAKGFDRGKRTSNGASLKGRIWSFEEAYTIKHWVDWCRRVGSRLKDEAINIDEVMKGFIRPEPATEGPALVALAVQWPEHVITNVSEVLRLSHNGIAVPLVDTALELRDFTTEGPIPIRFRNESWSLDYNIIVDTDGMHILAVAEDAELLGSRGVNKQESLSAYLSYHGLSILFEQETLIDDRSMLLKIDRDLEPYRREQLIALDWTGVNLQKESQGPDRSPDSVQARTIQWIRERDDWDLIIDDDSSYEMADIVALKIKDNTLFVHLTHCKYSGVATPGTRVKDLYEVCGQAMTSVIWRTETYEMLEHLRRREINRIRNRGFSGMIVGTAETLEDIISRVHRLNVSFKIAIAQPGLTAKDASLDQLRLIASTDAHIRQVTAGTFEAYCSE